MDFGLSHPSNTTVIIHNFLEVDDRFDSYLYAGQNKVQRQEIGEGVLYFYRPPKERGQ